MSSEMKSLKTHGFIAACKPLSKDVRAADCYTRKEIRRKHLIQLLGDGTGLVGE